MKDKKIVFMGTPIFAAEILRHLINNHVNIIGIVSQPDRAKDRKGNLVSTPTKKIAQEFDIQVFQPENIKSENHFLKKLEPDLIITAAYGQIVPKTVLDIPEYGCINVHGSLLPKYRGGAPIHYAILNGDSKTGVTIMEMVERMDAGDIISQKSFPIKFEDTLADVHENMIKISQEVLIKTIPTIFKGTYKKIPQNENKVVFSPTISKEEQLIDFTEQGINIYNKIRAFNPWPVAFSYLNGKRVKFYKTSYFEKKHKNIAGEIYDISENGIYIYVNGGYLVVEEFQIEGKSKVIIKEFINGNKFFNKGNVFSQGNSN